MWSKAERNVVVGRAVQHNVVRANRRTVFNHIGLCVADRERSRRFYEGLLGFTFWWDLELPDQGTAKLLQL